MHNNAVFYNSVLQNVREKWTKRLTALYIDSATKSLPVEALNVLVELITIWFGFLALKLILSEHILFCMYKAIENELQFDESSKRPGKVKLTEWQIQ